MGIAELRFLRLCIGAGLCLAFFLWACGPPAYRLEGRAPSGMAQVALLDSLARGTLDSVRQAHRRSLARLDTLETSMLDSLDQSASNLGEPIVRATRRYQEAQAAYREAFLQARRYRSFGGNPVLTEDDIGVSTQTLLSEIANRFYKGRAFSLETESELRRYIRQALAPLEQKVTQARAEMNRLRRSQSGREDAKRDAVAGFEVKRRDLFEHTNGAILATLADREFARSLVDSAGWYRFQGLSPGRYFVYAPQPLPQGYLVEVKLNAHTRQDLASENAQRLLIDPHSEK